MDYQTFQKDMETIIGFMLSHGVSDEEAETAGNRIRNVLSELKEKDEHAYAHFLEEFGVLLSDINASLVEFEHELHVSKLTQDIEESF